MVKLIRNTTAAKHASCIMQNDFAVCMRAHWVFRTNALRFVRNTALVSTPHFKNRTDQELKKIPKCHLLAI